MILGVLADMDEHIDSWSTQRPQRQLSQPMVDVKCIDSTSESAPQRRSPYCEATEKICQPEVKRETKKIRHQTASILPSFSSDSKKSSRARKVVSFSTVEKREYAITPGESPTCKDVLSITLDWKYNPQSTIVEIDQIFKSRYHPPCRLNYGERTRRLVEVTGLSAAELVETTLTRRIEFAKQLQPEAHAKNDRLDTWLSRRLAKELVAVQSF